LKKKHCSYSSFFQQFGLPLELALPIGQLEVIGGTFLIVGVVTRITAAAIFVIEMIGDTLIVGLSQGFVGGMNSLCC
jgi:uncharacterized membrane protein YphA (DoxX/SURF4 family)